MTIADIFSPVTLPQFFVEHFGVAPLHSSGREDRFAIFGSSANGDCSAVKATAWSLERELEAPVLPERCQDAGRLEPHRGERDLVILQAAGQTRWEIYGSAAQPASATPEWSALLGAGGALYVPRGRWRSALPQATRSVSWLFHIHNPTGADLLVWLADKVKEFEAFQTDLPRFASPAVQADYLTTLRKTFGAAFRTPGLFETFTRRLNRLAPLHPDSGGGREDGASLMIENAAPRPLRIYRRDRQTIYVSLAGRDIFFPADAAQLLQYINDQAPISAADFYRQFDREFDREDLWCFLEALSRDGIIAAIEPRLAL
jgi:hypothetical protein